MEDVARDVLEYSQLLLFFTVKPTSLYAFLTPALGWYSQKYVVQKYIHSKHASVLLYCFPLWFLQLWGLTCWPLHVWISASSDRQISSSSPGARVLSAGETQPVVTSAGTAPPGIQPPSRAGERLQRFPISCLVGENSAVLNSCLCRNDGGSRRGGDSIW